MLSLFTSSSFAVGNRPVAEAVGAQSVTVMDSANPALAGTQGGIDVVPGTRMPWVFTGLAATATAGTAQSFKLSAIDAAGNVATLPGRRRTSQSPSAMPSETWPVVIRAE